MSTTDEPLLFTVNKIEEFRCKVQYRLGRGTHGSGFHFNQARKHDDGV